MKRIVIAVAVIGCHGDPADPGASVDGSIDATGLPAGVWEPDPGPGREYGFLVADGEDIWFAYARTSPQYTGEVWLTKTTSTGDTLVAPRRVDSPAGDDWPVAFARTNDAIDVLWKPSGGTAPPRLTRLDAAGDPLDAQPTQIDVGSISPSYVNSFALAPRADGSLRVVAAYMDATTEVGVVDVDANGVASPSATLLGTASSATPLALSAVDVNGTTVVAWDRRYNECGDFGTDAVVTSSVADNHATAAVSDLDPEGLPDVSPALAASGGSAYVAWSHTTDAGSVIRVEPVGSPGSAIDVGLAPLWNYASSLALADATHGAIAWMTYEPTLRIAKLTAVDGNLVVGDPHTIAVPNGASLRGVVHVGDERYVISWTDMYSGTANAYHLYAMMVDLAIAPAPAPAPAAPVQPPPARSLRCHL